MVGPPELKAEFVGAVSGEPVPCGMTANSFFKKCVPRAKSSGDCIKLLQYFVEKGSSNLGLLARKLVGAAIPISQFDFLPDAPDILPLPTTAVRKRVALQPEVANAPDPGLVTILVAGVSLALNLLYCAGWARHPISARVPLELTVVQCSLIDDVVRACLDFACDVKEFDFGTVISSLREKRISYSGEAVSVRRELIAALVTGVVPLA